MNAFRGLDAELIVRMLLRMPAQVDAGNAGWPVRQGTGVAPNARSPDMIAAWPVFGRKMLVLVNMGTAFCAFCRSPSKAINMKVWSFLMGNPIDPPYCCLLNLSFTGWPKESAFAGLNKVPGARA